MVGKASGHKLRDKPKKYSTAESRKSPNSTTKEKETSDPEGSAMAIDAMTDPFSKLTLVAKECGFPVSTIKALKRRLETKYQLVGEEIKGLKTPQLLKLIDEKLHMALDHMDEYTFANAELRDLAVTFGILAEKRQLLMGEPTQILSVSERSHMNDLIPAIIKEAGRRGMTIDVTPINVDDEPGVNTRVLPVHETTELEVSRTARKFLDKKPIVDRSLE